MRGTWDLKLLSEVDYFRVAIGSVFALYYASLFADLNFLFGPDQMIDSRLTGTLGPSILHAWQSSIVLFALYGFLLALSIAFILGRLGRLGVIALLMCHVSFINGNPLIIHEPQQFMSMFLFIFIAFLSPRKNVEQDAGFVKICVVALGSYYLIVGLKKVPDPAWLDGSAVGCLAQWQGIASDNIFSKLISTNPTLSRLCTWFGLLLEIFYLPLVLTRFRPALLVLVVAFHMGIALVFDLGNFSLAMIAWNAIALDHKTRAVYKSWFANLRLTIFRNSGASRMRQI